MSIRGVETGNHHINNSVILRDGELFHLKAGLGFYSKKLLERHRDKVKAVEGWRVVWLPGETKELSDQVSQKKSTLVVGELGAGKSALVYGLRALWRVEDKPYVLVDGHFTETSAEKINAGLLWAQKNQAAVIWDSLDYLIGKSRRIRKLPMAKQQERTRKLVSCLTSFMEDGGVLIGTSHSESWIKFLCDPELIEGPWKQLTTRMDVHQVRGVFEKPEEATQFYSLAKLEPPEASYLANLKDNPRLRQLLTPVNYRPETIEEIYDSLTRYRIAKLIALDPREISQDLRSLLKAYGKGDAEESTLLRQIIDFIIIKNKETKSRMGIR